MNDASVSVVIPCYNAEEYVAEAIHSALIQTYPNKEVIVIDDGSTDASLSVIKSFGDAIRWETGCNRGGCAARNRGIELARGEWIQFLDADDLLQPDKLEVHVPIAVNMHPVTTYTDWWVSSEGSEYERGGADSAEKDRVVFAVEDWMPTAAPLHPKAHLLSVEGFREDLSCSQERDLHLRLALEGYSFHRVRRPLFRIRRRAGSVSGNLGRVLDQRSFSLASACRHLKGQRAMTERRAQAFAQRVAKDARLYLWLGERRKAVEHFRWARRIHRSGGLNTVYNRRIHRIGLRLFGPVNMERIFQFRRRLGTLFHG